MTFLNSPLKIRKHFLWIVPLSMFAIAILLTGTIKMAYAVSDATKFMGKVGGYAEFEEELHPQIQQARADKADAYDAVDSVTPITSVFRNASFGDGLLSSIPAPTDTAWHYTETDSVFFLSIEAAEKAMEALSASYVNHGYHSLRGKEFSPVVKKGQIIEGWPDPRSVATFGVTKGLDEDDSYFEKHGAYESQIAVTGIIHTTELSNGEPMVELFVSMGVIVDVAYEDLPVLVGNTSLLELGFKEAWENNRLMDSGKKPESCPNRTYDSIHFTSIMGDWVSEYGCQNDPTPIESEYKSVTKR